MSSFIGQDYAIVNWREPNASDNSGVVNVSSTIKSGSRFYIGTTYVTYTAVDPSNNADDYTFNIIVIGEYVIYNLFALP